MAEIIANTKYSDVLTSFQTMPMMKNILDAELCKEWFYKSLGEYELEISSLTFDNNTMEFNSILPRYVISTLATLMYTYYLTRELSRVEKLNGIAGKDVVITGIDATKRVTLSDLQLQLSKAEKTLHKLKTHSFNN